MWKVSAAKLREAMLNTGVGTTELCARSGLTKDLIVKLRRGNSNSRDGTVYKIAQALGVKPREILEE